MPKLGNVSMKSLSILGSKGTFQFSAVKIEDLGATEYTLVNIAVDISGSVCAYAAELLNVLKSVISACKKSPRAENLLIRLIQFNHNIKEVHGFKPLSGIDPDNDYKMLVPDGQTALFDAAFSGIGSILTYAKQLTDQDFGVNGICFIITDGVENASQVTANMIAEQTAKVKKGEEIESLLTILVGINTADCNTELEQFKNDAGLSSFVDVGDATAQRLAKLATFVSKSISSQSKALGSGGSSTPLTF